MDLQLLGRVIWRFKGLVVAGTVLACALAVFSYVRVSFDDGLSITYRESESWESLSTVFVTSRGFPWGSIESVPPEGEGEAETSRQTSPAVDSGRLTTLAAIYMQLASGDGVRALMLRDGPIEGSVSTFPVFAGNNGPQLPLITLAAVGATPQEAHVLGGRYLNAFLRYLRQQQIAGNIEKDDRVRLQVVRQQQPPSLLEGRSKTVPVLVFIAVMTGVIGLAFVLENARPGRRPPADQVSVVEQFPAEARAVEPTTPRDATRRTA